MAQIHAPDTATAIHAPFLPGGEAGPPGPEGKEGKEGPAGPAKLTAGVIAEIEAQLWKLLLVEKIEKLKEIVGESLIIKKLKELVGTTGLTVAASPAKEGRTLKLASYPANETAKLVMSDLVGTGTGPFTFLNELKVQGLFKITTGAMRQLVLGLSFTKTEPAAKLGTISGFGAEPVSFLRVKAEAASFTAGGLNTSAATEVSDGAIRVILNVGTTALTFVSEATEVEVEVGVKEAVEAKNRLLLPLGELVLKQNELVMFIWDGTTERWRNIEERYTAGEGLELSGRSFKVKALGIVTGMLAEGAVTAIKLGAEAVETAKIKAEAVTEGKIAALAVTTAKLAAEAVTGPKLKPGVPEASKELKAATKIKGITGSSTIVYLSVVFKAELTEGELIADGKVIYKLLPETLATSSKIVYLSFKMKAGAEFELKLAKGALEGTTSIYVLQEG